MRLGPIEFVTPAMVEGPKIMFFVPVPEVFKTAPFVMATDVGYGLPVTSVITTTWFIMLAIFLLFKFGTKKLSIVPGKLQTALEGYYLFIDSLVGQMLGKWKVKYIGYIGTLFMFILTSNILSFIPIPAVSYNNGIFEIYPAFKSPTGDLNTTAGLALLTTVTFLMTSFKLNGVVGHIKGMFEPIPIMFPLNVIGELAKPTNISVRLFGNLFAGSIILGLMYKAAPLLVPIPLHCYFDLFGGTVQTFVFTMLSLVYIQGSLGDHEYKEEN